MFTCPVEELTEVNEKLDFAVKNDFAFFRDTGSGGILVKNQAPGLNNITNLKTPFAKILPLFVYIFETYFRIR